MTALAHLQLRPLIAGVYGDNRGRIHLDMPALLLLHGMETEPVLCRVMARIALKEVRRELPHPVLIAHIDGIAVH